MAFQLLINVIIAIVWMLFQNSFTIVDFVIGFTIGFFVVLVLIRFKGYEFYFSRVLALLKLMLIFAKELAIANVVVLKAAFSPKMDVAPGIVAVPTKLETDAEKTLFAVMMTLTPGTLSIEFSLDNNVIFVHALDARDREGIIDSVQNTFEKSILEVTRR
ncbi:multicomponent Na+:H+ antiporter subunit E [Alkalihalobacillus xiaoxiensis]|uniref:Multicomponent Na+:H+ antiporter subunit E n=1 Tax=Shouchella xiaoxiensis TaxID=766895 RepID=A0ABS2SRB6_9BACI|nr:Na+/H+ antiporter subunit E [Shouchella xiaoxiensis]MBM7838052.1 multicomponent Na+:H+ antiporter subunit E [Shouchella xiaoxiensis]